MDLKAANFGVGSRGEEVSDRRASPVGNREDSAQLLRSSGSVGPRDLEADKRAEQAGLIDADPHLPEGVPGERILASLSRSRQQAALDRQRPVVLGQNRRPFRLWPPR